MIYPAEPRKGLEKKHPREPVGRTLHLHDESVRKPLPAAYDVRGAPIVPDYLENSEMYGRVQETVAIMQIMQERDLQRDPNAVSLQDLDPQSKLDVIDMYSRAQAALAATTTTRSAAQAITDFTHTNRFMRAFGALGLRKKPLPPSPHAPQENLEGLTGALFLDRPLDQPIVHAEQPHPYVAPEQPEYVMQVA